MSKKTKQTSARWLLWGGAYALALGGCAGPERRGEARAAVPAQAQARPQIDTAQLQRERDGLKAKAGGADAAALRDYGLAQLILGDAEAARATLEKARAAAPGDVRTLLGLGLDAQEQAQTRRAQELWLSLLEQVAGDKKAAADPLAPAAAELAAHRLLVLGADGGGAQAEAALRARVQRLWQKSQRLPVEAQQLVAALAGQLARLASDETDARAIDAARGCPARVYVSGPAGHLPALDLLSPQPADDPARDGARARYERKDASGCSVEIEGVPGRPGVWHATAWAERKSAGEQPVIVESGGAPFALYVDGQRVYLEQEPIRRRPLTVKLGAGWHALTVKLGVYGRAQVQLAVPGATFFDGKAEAAPAPAGGEAVATLRPLSPIPDGTRPSEQVLAGFLRAQQSFEIGDAESGRVIADRLGPAAPDFASLTMLRAGLQLEDRSRPDRLTRDQARGLLEQALKSQPRHFRARQSLATLLLQDEHADQALTLLDEAPPQQPGEASWQTALLRNRLLKARGWTVEAERALAEARRLGPSACTTLDALVDARREVQDVGGTLAAAAQLARCNPYTDRYADSLDDASRHDEAIGEYRRLLKLEPENASWRHGLAKVLLARRGASDLTEARTLLTELVARAPRNTGHRIELADLLVGLGERDAALATLREGLGPLPESAELHKALRALEKPDEMESYRVDGREVIRAFLAQKQETFAGEAAVLLLDRTVVRVLPSGARLTLTHNIIRVLTKDGATKFGEVSVPEGAEVLTLRTIKQNGQTREPEEIPEKDTVSAPDLEEGDFVEFEYLDRDPPLPSFPGGFLAERFYFASTDAPLDRSEYVVVAPAAMALQIDARGPLEPAQGASADKTEKNDKTDKRVLPSPEVKTVGGEKIYSFRYEHVARMRPEPPIAEGLLDDWMPSVRVGAGLSFPGYVNYLRERRVRSLRQTPEIRAQAVAIGGPPLPAGAPAADIVERARKVDAWVRKNIRQGGSVDDVASAALARREGRRDVILLALLRASGVPAEAWLVRPQNAPRLEGPLPNVTAYSEIVLAVLPAPGQAGAPLLWLDPMYRHSPSGYVRPMLRGARALRMPEEPGTPPLSDVSFTEVRLPAEGGSPEGLVRAGGAAQPPYMGVLRDERKLDLKMQLDADGGGVVTVKESLRGWPALEWREQVENLAEDKLRQEIEQRALGFFFPGASLEELRYGPMTDDDATLTVEYRFRAPQLARRREGELVLPAPFPTLLSKHYVSVARRSLPMLIHYVVPTVLDADVRLPAGAQVVRLRPPVELSEFGRFLQRIEQLPTREPGKDGKADTTLHLHTEASLPLVRVLPSRYPQFVEFAGRVDVSEDGVALIALPKP